MSPEHGNWSERWTTSRLQALVDVYRRKYWPRGRRLAGYVIEASPPDAEWLGFCDYDRRVIMVNAGAHSSERELRATLLHEMAHVAAGRTGHGVAFWSEIERLLAVRAPVTVSFPELGERGRHPWVIPARFPLAKRLFERVFAAEQRRLRQMLVRPMSTRDIETEAEDAAAEGAAWSAYWDGLCEELGLKDLDGKLAPFAQAVRKEAQRGFRRGARHSRQEALAKAQFDAAAALTAQAGQSQGDG